MQSRYYDPSVGRFLNIDDTSYLSDDTASSLNLYSYAVNNPVMRKDITGFSSEEIWTRVAAGAAIIGTIVGLCLFIVPGGAAVGGILVSTSVGSLIGGTQSVKKGGSYLAGAAGGSLIGLGLGLAAVFGGGLLFAAAELSGLLTLGAALGGLSLGFGFGFLGGYYGYKVTQMMNNEVFNQQSAINSGLLFGEMGVLSAYGGGMVNSVYSTIGITETTFITAGGFAATIAIGAEIVIDITSYLIELFSNG